MCLLSDEKCFIIRHNTQGKNTKEIAEDFKRNNKFIKQSKMKRIGVQHIILSFHPKEAWERYLSMQQYPLAT